MSWFRFYDEALDDPKVQRLPAEIFRGWVNLLCLAKRNGGTLPSVKDIAFALRMNERQARGLIDILVSAELIDVSDGIAQPHNWRGRQFTADVSTERVRRFRKRNETVSETVSETANETPPETETETETEREEPPLPPHEMKTAIQLWNEFAECCGLASVQKITETRKRRLATRLREAGGLDGWKAALAKLRASSFCKGANDRGWRADFDFLLQEKSFTRLMEGFYDDRQGNGKPEKRDWWDKPEPSRPKGPAPSYPTSIDGDDGVPKLE